MFQRSKGESLDAWKFLLLPVLITIVILVIYGTELYLADSLRYDAAYEYITSPAVKTNPIIQFSAPFLHSDHGHVFWNIIWFLPISAILLKNVESKEYLLIFLLVAWITGTIAPLIFADGVNYGISGANAALAGWGVVVGLVAMNRSADKVESGYSIEYGVSIVEFAIPSILTGIMIGQTFGFSELPSGASGFGHGFGVIFGLVWGIYWFSKETDVRALILNAKDRNWKK